MFKKEELKEIIKIFEEANLQEFRIKEKDIEVEMKKNIAEFSSVRIDSLENNETIEKNVNPGSDKEQEEVEDNFHIVKSPIVGTFYTSATPEDKKFIEVGEEVEINSVVCIVEAMKLYNEVEAEVKGKVIEQIVENGVMVEYGQPLFKIEKTL